MDKGRDAGIAAGGAPRQADDARVKPGPAPRHGLVLPSSLLPLLLLFLGACGVWAEKAGPLTRRDDDDAGPQDTAAPPSADADLTPQARANLIRMCLKALSENTLQQSAIDELCTLAGLGPGNRDLIDSTNDVTWEGRPLKDGSRTPPAAAPPRRGFCVSRHAETGFGLRAARSASGGADRASNPP